MVYGIIAAGEGSRLRADGYPGFKPMVEIAGETLISRLIRIFYQNAAKAVYIILNTGEKEVGTYIQALPAGGLPIHIIYRDTPSSFHSFYELVHSMPPGHRHELCISTIDPIFRETAFQDYIAAFRAVPALDGLMAVTDFVEDDKPLYVYTDGQSAITKFASLPHPERPWVSGGIYLLRQKAIAAADTAMKAGVSKMRNYQQALLEAGLCLRAHDLGRIIDIDHISDIPLAEALIQSTTI